MATEKAPQFYFNLEDKAEADLAEWARGLPRGRKSLASIETMIAGRAIARVCQPIADLLIAATRRGEDVTLDQLEDYISMFKAHNAEKKKVELVVTEPVKTPVVNAETPETAQPEERVEEQLEIDDSNGFSGMGQ